MNPLRLFFYTEWSRKVTIQILSGIFCVLVQLLLLTMCSVLIMIQLLESSINYENLFSVLRDKHMTRKGKTYRGILSNFFSYIFNVYEMRFSKSLLI